LDLISAEGVGTDPKMIEYIRNWPTPYYVKELKSFLGLARYYKKFIRTFVIISKPLANLYG
jgi:RNase adaptor protein for sRNA GlmZ degradation